MNNSVFIKVKDLGIAFCLYLFVWAALAVSTNYVSSGLHFQEDYEIIDGMKAIHQKGYKQTVYGETLGELHLRFRPLYNIYRYTGFYIFGLDFAKWHLFFVLFYLATSLVIFQICRLLGMSFWLALLCPLIFITGSVSDVLARLGTSELFGSFFTALAFYLILRLSTAVSRRKLFEFGAHLFVFLAVCSKEAFVLMIPTFIAVKLFSDYRSGQTNINELLKRNSFFIAVQLSILFLCIYMIKFYIGALGPIYGGFDGDIKNALLFVFDTMLSSLNFRSNTEGTGIYFLFIVAGFLALLLSRRLYILKLETQTLLFFTIGYLYICISQYLLHYKIVLDGHYLLPFMFGPSIVICLLIMLISERMGTIARVLSYGALILLLFIKADQSYQQMKIYADEGNVNMDLINKIKTTSKPNEQLLICGDELIHMEHFLALSQYINYFTSGEVQVTLQLLPADEQKFMQLSGVGDSTLLPRFKELVHGHYEHCRQIGTTPLGAFDQALVLSYCNDRFLKVNNADSLLPLYSKQIIGKDWYQYTLYTKPK